MEKKISDSRLSEKEINERFNSIEDSIKKLLRRYNRRLQKFTPLFRYGMGAIMFYCPHCGCISYGEWPQLITGSYLLFEPRLGCWNLDNRDCKIYETEESKIYDDYYALRSEINEAIDQDIIKVLNVKKCPFCEGNLLREPGYFGITSAFIPDEESREIGEYTILWNTDEVDASDYDMLKLDREKNDDAKAVEIVKNKQRAYDIFVPENSSEKIEKTRDSLKKHVKHLLDLELNIFALSKRLNDLYVKELQYKRLVSQSKYDFSSKEKAEVNLVAAQEKYNEILKEYEAKKESVVAEVDVVFPEKPVEPNYKEEGFFNKKKVREENENLKKQYDERLRLYELEYAEMKELQERLTVEEKKRHDEEVNNLYHKLVDTQNEVEEAQKCLESVVIEKEPDELIVKTYSLIDDEIKSAEDLLEKIYKCRNEMYAYDLVFLKYRNPVALATFYEYLSAGRCDSLEGSNGAYNIYEAECKANLIISKLSQIVETLEEIKDNQYMIYSKLNEINGQLGSLNSSMDKAIDSLANIENGVAHIADNSDVIAYNSQITAYYSKVNAELTNSLGYLIALS